MPGPHQLQAPHPAAAPQEAKVFSDRAGRLAVHSLGALFAKSRLVTSRLAPPASAPTALPTPLSSPPWAAAPTSSSRSSELFQDRLPHTRYNHYRWNPRRRLHWPSLAMLG